jgi:uncharacterized protein YkvS
MVKQFVLNEKIYTKMQKMAAILKFKMAAKGVVEKNGTNSSLVS